jgi:hypothetical protein
MWAGVGDDFFAFPPSVEAVLTQGACGGPAGTTARTTWWCFVCGVDEVELCRGGEMRGNIVLCGVAMVGE